MTTAEDLLNTLNDLIGQQFEQFKWFLKQEVIPGFPAISAAPLETANRHETVDLMVQKYRCQGALEITMKVLEKISRNDLVESLVNISSRPKVLKSHDPAPGNSNHGGKKAKLVEANAEIKLMIQEREMKILEINRSAEFNSKSADRHIADSRQVYAVLQQAVERSLANLTEAIKEKQETMRREAERIVQELQREISELTKRSADMEQLSNTEDHPDFLQRFSSLSTVPPMKTWTDVIVPLPAYGGSVGAAVNQLEEVFKKEKENLIAKAKLKRAQQFAKDVTLDPQTANRFLILSNDGKKVHCGDVARNLPDNPERFNPAINVLGKQSFSSGRFYFEVEVKGKTSWDLGVVKESIERKGSLTANRENGFWTICWRTRKENNHAKSPLRKVGVFVDYEKRSVSFFDVDSAELLKSFTDCSFTEKLYPFFSPGLRYNGKNVNPLIISAVSYSD